MKLKDFCESETINRIMVKNWKSNVKTRTCTCKITGVNKMGVTETAEANSQLSLDLYQEITQRIEPGAHIECIEEEHGSGRGDNYTATLYRIHLRGHRKCSTDGKKQKWEKTVISKRLPENLALREAYKSEKLFRNEVKFYTCIIPELLKYQSTKTDKFFSAIPKCYMARPDLLIMEDLRLRDFKMPDRKQGLTYDETEIVLKQVAQFHGLSLAYKFENYQKFVELKNLATEGLFCAANESWYKNYYQRLTENAIKMVSEEMPKDSKYLNLLKDFIDVNFFKRMIALVSNETTLSAICHGDCWANNFLYRYETSAEGMKPIEVCLVDFQLIRYASIALDVANLLFCCTTKVMRDAHFDSLINTYTSEVFQWLQLLCLHIPDVCSTKDKFHNEFLNELKLYGRFALGLALDIIPISTCSSEDAPDLYLTAHRANDLESGAPDLNIPPNDLCRQKMTEILIDLVDRGML